MTNTHLFSIPKNQSLKTWEKKLCTELGFTSAEEELKRRVYYDTFDWKLYDGNCILELEENTSQKRFRWFDRKSGRMEGHFPVTNPPKFIWDFPRGAMKNMLAPLMDVRSIMPKFTIHSQTIPLNFLDDNQKTVVRAFLEKSALQPSDEKKQIKLGSYLHLVPIRGYEQSFENILSKLAECATLDKSLFDLSVEKLNIVPSSFSSKLNVPVKRKDTSEDATKRVYKKILHTIQINEPGVRSDLDSEFLHDFRVSVRRTRAGLSQIKDVFPLVEVEHFKTEFAWLGELTGPSRDLDVYLLGFSNFHANLPEDFRKELEPLREFLKSEKVREHKALVTGLQSARYQKIIDDWQTFLNTPIPKETSLSKTYQSIGETVNQRIWKLYRRAVAEGAAIDADTHDEALHDLRKTCKKLRYMIEFFKNLYPAEEVKGAIKILKVLQDNLGTFNDQYVQWTSLIRYSGQSTASGTFPPKTLVAMGMLVKDLQNQQDATRQKFHECFEIFTAPENKKRFESLFRP